MKKNEMNTVPTIEKSYYLHDQKKRVSFRSPDIDKMQEVRVDEKTTLYIPIDASADEAKTRYLEKLKAKSRY